MQDKYVDRVFGLNEELELTQVKQELDRNELAFMSISPSEARILQFLIRGFGIRKIVEVGTLYGYSSLCMAQALPDDGRIVTLEKSAEQSALAKTMLAQHQAGSKVEVLCGDAAAILPTLSGHGPFDMVFIDADKAGYGKYLDWAEKNLRRGGLIVGDNTFLFGALWGEPEDREIGPKQVEIMTRFNARLADRSLYNSMIIPSRQGMTVAQKL
jgi:predicted O-methyltransferase YrrM